MESRTTVILIDIHLWGERIQWLFANTTSIHFKGCEGLDIMFEKLAANSDEVIGCFDTVKFLEITKSRGRFGVGRNAKCDMLPNLEDITLRDLNNLSCVSALAMQLGMKFSKLRIIWIAECPQLKYVISLGTIILSLEKLQTIGVHSCEQVEELFKFDQNSGLDSVLFPNLERIILGDCPRLRSLSEQNIACPRLEVVDVYNCPRLNKLSFTDQNFGSIKEIIGTQEWWDELEWDSDNIKNTLQPCFIPIYTAK
ncbi:UNVERIFIED_CONTAM: hypothetical protein Sangu_0044200 [Sesamum angustifolium]|uniref:Disease resistance protein At4g27190-like leucine-rich repeats domain-containing protein n=1 Tax=Sesamum angustifolium TaxID=2727405 RepID=A0AAW2RIH3_9LAMI